MFKILVTCVSALSLFLMLQGCGLTSQSNKYSSSVMDYLYPKEHVIVRPSIPTLCLPIKVGIAFVPEKDNFYCSIPLSEVEKTEAIELVRQAFSQYHFIDTIEIIPSSYLQREGGFPNLEFIRNIFEIDVAVLLSYDQIVHNRENIGALTYLTIVGAYLIPGDSNNIHTMIDATVYHIESRKLLFRAPGVSEVCGYSNMVNLNENQRLLRCQGFHRALKHMIPQLQCELESFKVKMQQKPEDYEVVYQPGYTGGGSLDAVFLIIAGTCLLGFRRRHAK